MPNWCTNNVSITHTDPEMIKRMKAAIAEDKLFEEFVPNPKNEWDYLWCVENWGVKWNPNNVEILEEDSTSLILMFDSAWAAPVQFYNHLTEQGFSIDATYHEPGMSFAGHYSSESGDSIYEYDFSDVDWRDHIDNEDVLGLLESEYEVWTEWNENNELEDEEVENEADR